MPLEEMQLPLDLRREEGNISGKRSERFFSSAM
jgi:hypothetical protein